MNIKSGRFWIVVFACVGVVLGVVVLGSRPARSQRLADGSMLTLVDVQCGTNNLFVVGTSLQRLIGGLVPSNGIGLLGFKLTPPMQRSLAQSQGEQLDFLFRLSGATNNQNPFLDRRFPEPQFRLVMRARSGHDYEGFLGSFLAPFNYSKVGSHRYAFGSMTAFPRDEKWLDLQVVTDREGDRQVLARFRLKNPASRSSRAWRPDATPITRQFDQIEMTLGDVTTGPRVWRTPDNPSDTGSIPLRVLEHGTVTTNWSLHNIRARDGLGNYWYVPSFGLVSNDWCYHAIWGGLDPARVWKLEAHLARGGEYSAHAENFSPDELCIVQVPVPLRTPLQTNLHDVPAEISAWNQTGLNVQIPTNRADLRVTFVSARDDNGKEFPNPTGNWGQWHFARNFYFSRSCKAVEVTFAIHRDYAFECYVQPQRKPGTDAHSGPPRNP